MKTLQELTAELDAAQASITELTLRIGAMDASILAQEAAADELRKQLESIEAGLAGLRGYAQGLNDQLGAAVALKEDIDAQIAALQEKPADILRPVNRTASLRFTFWHASDRYSRWQEHEAWLAAEARKISFRCINTDNGGGEVKLSGVEYVLLCDGKPIASTAVAAGATKGSFTVPAGAVSHGWHVLEVAPQGVESSIPWPVFVRHPGGAEPQWMPVGTSSLEITRGSEFRIMWVPAALKPTIVPLAPRTFAPVTTAVSRTKLNLEHLAPSLSRRPALAKGGELTTMQRQWYTVGDTVAKVPRQPLVDGPRGQASTGFITHVMIGTATQTADPTTPPRNNVYACTPWSVIRVSQDGTITTLAGYRHPGLNNYWEDPSNVEVVGDFAPGEPMFHEIWGATWVQATLAVDTSAAPIPSEENRQPHLVGPRMLVTNPQNDRVQMLEFPARSHGPAKVTTWFQGSDCWDVVGPWRGSYFVSDRGNHRVVQLDKDGKIERVLLQGLPLSKINLSRLIDRLAPLETIRAQPGVTGPEGLALMDDWLYVASKAMNQVKRINLVSGEVQIVRNFASASLDYFMKIAVSDGTFGPRHTLFITDWSVKSFGLPAAFAPDGTPWALSTASSPELPRGAGGNWGGVAGYNGGIGVGGGRLVGGGASQGLYEVSLAQAAPLIVSRYSAGGRQWTERGYWLTHGWGGFCSYGLPLPWGETPEIDYYLQCHGHKQ